MPLRPLRDLEVLRIALKVAGQTTGADSGIWDSVTGGADDALLEVQGLIQQVMLAASQVA
ncbi:hypothetical protein D5S18_19145 [Nocardia panacis]|uniref:Uncharacterized protein n=1 Tax=Nocardia panacis TaxID=2340916 RepID=A0A3A4KK50_9NOCA|nr:hypothetical protein [Nocardia panacis]RJO73357.1 hypothetical protein D5S18_19145 [Nocardia panacis]